VFTFFVRRLLVTIPVIFCTLSLLFLLFFVIPGDPVERMAGGGDGRNVSATLRRNVERKYGFDKSKPEQFVRFWQRLGTGDLGTSYKSNTEVSTIVGRTAVASARLAFWAILIEIFIGIGAGVLSAVRRYSFLDGLTTITTAAMSAIPVFVLAYLLQLGLGVFTHQHDWPGWTRFPVQGIGPDTWALGVIPTGDQWKYLILPAITLASVSTALVTRLTRTTMLEVVRADYLRTARAKGLLERQVILRHGLRNAMIPVVTYIGIDFATLMGAAVLTETVYAWPGMGSRITTAIEANDVPVVIGVTLVVVVVYVAANLAVDLSYGWFDPRIRSARNEGRS
jgi:ABC-type dipeptide/oligopeptide/nickel transport system permease component